jgi:hypothetical protein
MSGENFWGSGPSMHQPYEDAVVGRVAWDAAGQCWAFDAGPIGNHHVPAKYVPTAGQSPFDGPEWGRVRACVLWVRANEPSVRANLLGKIGPISVCRFERRPVLYEMLFLKSSDALLMYGGCDDAVWWVRVDAEGRIADGAFRCESGEDA